MKEKEYSPTQILKALKEASPFDLFLVSFLLLPFIFNAWLVVLDKLQATASQKIWFLAGVLVFYIVGVLAMLVGSTRLRRREIARDEILAHIRDSKVTWVSFSKIREQINSSYTDRFLRSVITEFPYHLQFASVRGKDNEVRFIGVSQIVEHKSDEV